jgi:hypothetical protein
VEDDAGKIRWSSHTNAQIKLWLYHTDMHTRGQLLNQTVVVSRRQAPTGHTHAGKPDPMLSATSSSLTVRLVLDLDGLLGSVGQVGAGGDPRRKKN